MNKKQLESQLEELQIKGNEIKQQLATCYNFKEKLEMIFSNMDVSILYKTNSDESYYTIEHNGTFIISSELHQLEKIHGKIISIEGNNSGVILTVMENLN